MCLLLFAYRSHPRYPLIVAANRDESFTRPTKPAGFWGTDPEILGGMDLKGGGTWLGINPTGSFSAITNYRNPVAMKNNLPSRGQLVVNFLRSKQSPETYLRRVSENEEQHEGGQHNGYNLLVFRNQQLGYYSNRGDTGPRLLSPGIYGLSNHLLNTPWPKVEMGRERLRRILGNDEVDPEAILQILSDRQTAGDQFLPVTGVPPEVERSLSSIFIRMDGYGTRCSTIVLLDNDGTFHFVELSYDEEGEKTTRVSFEVSAGPP